MFRRFLMSLAVAAFVAVTVNANAASYKVTPVFKQAFDNAFNVLPGYDPAASPGVAAILQYDFNLEFTPTGSETMGAVVFDVTLNGLTMNAGLSGWQANNPTVDSNGVAPGGNVPLWANAADLGLIDLKNITHGVAANLTTNPAVDPRLRVGRGQGIVVDGQDIDTLGNLYLDWDGSSPASLTVDMVSAGFRDSANGMLIVDANAVLTGGEITIGGIVETPIFESTPAGGSTIDFGYGGQNRTESLATRNVGGGTLQVLNAVIGGANADLFRVNGFAPYDLVGGAGDTGLEIEFLAELSGGPGTYAATLELVGADGNLATYVLTAQVPEPSTVALASLGLLGLVGFARRRG